VSGVPRRWSSLGARKEVRPTSSVSGKQPDRFRCSARKVARGGVNAEGGIVGGDNANWVFE